MSDGMDGMAMSGTPWIETPDEIYNYGEYECTLNSTELCDYQQGYWRFWYESDHRYAVPTTAFFTAAIVLFGLAFIWTSAAPRYVKEARTSRKIVALTRFFAYRVFRLGKLNWNSAPVGLLLLAAVGVVFFFAMVLGPRPFYWPNTDTIAFGDSPPLATRSGWLAIGCMPFVFATAGKSNLITAVTGVSHERLQVFHRWIAYTFFILALLHTFPFIVYNVKEGMMVMQWQTSSYYWTGVVALLAQAWLTFASFSPLRNLAYEFFKFTHFLAGVVFMVFFFVHCDFTLSSVDYFIVTGVIFAVTWLHSHLRMFFEHGFGTRAIISPTSSGFVKIVVPLRSTWKVGQHMFIRFLHPSMEPWGSHPFTICSLPERSSFLDQQESNLVFYVRPRGGLTKALARHAQVKPDQPVRVLLDGPYGGVSMQKIAESDRSLVIAGGSGAGFILPFIESHLRRLQLLKMARADNDSDVKSTPTASPSLRIILATREAATRNWFKQAVADLVESFRLSNESEEQGGESNLAVEVFYTGLNTGSSSDADSIGKNTLEKYASSDIEKAAEPVATTHARELEGSSSESEISEVRDAPRHAPPQMRLDVSDFGARPDLPAVVCEEARTMRGRALGVFVCGPLGMQSDVSNAAAAEQLRLMRDGDGEIYLHTEHFSWA